MRVLQLVTQARGGPVDHAVDVAVELARSGHQSHLVGPAGDHLTAAAAAGVVTHPVEVRSKTDLGGARAVSDVIARVAPDVVHLQDRRAGLVGRTVATRRAVPSVYTLHGVPDQLAGLVPGNIDVGRRRLRDRVTYLALERLLATAPRSAVVAPCEALADYLRHEVGVPADRVHTIPNGVREPDRGTAGSDQSDRPVRVLWLGLMQPVKRVPDLVRAAAHVPGIELDLVGDGPERPRIEDAIERAGGTTRVRLLGHRADPSSYLRAADVFVLPSAAEACPLALLQAMASGLAVVASRVGGVPEIVRDGVDGVLVDPGSVEQLTAALTMLGSDRDHRLRLGAAARARVTDRFGLERSVRSLVGLYEQVAG